MDALILARMQFAANITFHILFSTISIALGVVSGITMNFQFGTTLSAFWILALNSWMQTPAGHEIVDGEFHVASWLEVIFNPSFPYRFAHMLLASALTCAFLLTGLSAWQVIGQLTIWQAASSAPALKVILVGVCISVPAIVGYTVFSYRVFRGNTGELRYA